ncbi:MAG: hypothetical protein KKC64_15990, partial [Spirochaetes bacterium]|nr:hypothetical protein [Spirochaetota bacterium]
VSQKNGEEQVAALQQTHRRLLAALPTYQNARILHLNIIAGAPFFVHGLIRGGLGKSYAAPVQPEQVLVLFAKQAENFARPLGLSVDNRGTWLLVNSAGELQWTLKDDGAATAELLAERLRN